MDAGAPKPPAWKYIYVIHVRIKIKHQQVTNGNIQEVTKATSSSSPESAARRWSSKGTWKKLIIINNTKMKQLILSEKYVQRITSTVISCLNCAILEVPKPLLGAAPKPPVLGAEPKPVCKQ